MIYLLYSVAPYTSLHTIVPDFFSLSEEMEFSGTNTVIFSSRGDNVGNISCSTFLVGSL